jgi:hypothetical protein
MNHVATLSQLVCTAFGVAGILWGASARHATFETLTAHELNSWMQRGGSGSFFRALRPADRRSNS